MKLTLISNLILLLLVITDTEMLAYRYKNDMYKHYVQYSVVIFLGSKKIIYDKNAINTIILYNI